MGSVLSEVFVSLLIRSLYVFAELNLKIPEVKMPILLLIVTVFYSTLPQWASSRLSNNAAN